MLLILQVINTLHAALGHDLEADHVLPRAERVLDAADEVVGLQHQQRLPVHRLQALGHVVKEVGQLVLELGFLTGSGLGAVDALEYALPWPAGDHAREQDVQLLADAQLLRVHRHLLLVPGYDGQP